MRKVYLKHQFNRLLLNKIALPIIRRIGKDSNYVKHFKHEREIIFKGKEKDCADEWMDRDVCDLLCLLHTQGDSGFSIGFKRRLFDRAAAFKIISPLTFKDDEFNQICYDGSAQNARMSSVFKDKDGRIYDIDAIPHDLTYRYNIDTKQIEEGSHTTWSGGVMLYDDIEHTGWGVITRGYIKPNHKEFYGEHHVVLPSIEIVDNNCGRGTFIMTISKRSAIPAEFFKDYELVLAKDWHEDNAVVKEHEVEFIDILNKL